MPDLKSLNQAIAKTEVLNETVEILNDIATVLEETAKGENSFTKSCRNKNLNWRYVRRVLTSHSFENCREGTALPLESVEALRTSEYETLYQNVFYTSKISDVALPPDFEESANYVLNSLPTRTREMICKLCGIDCLAMTLDELGEEYHLTRERSRQITEKGYSMLRSVPNSIILMKGIARYKAEMEIAEERKKAELELIEEEKQNTLKNILNSSPTKFENNQQNMDILNYPIQKLNLSIRCTNALYAAGIDTVKSMLEISDRDLKNIKNIGCRSFDEIKKMQTELLSVLLIPTDN